MPIEIDGEVYLNGREAAAYFGLTYGPFKEKLESGEIVLEEYRMKGRTRYFKQSDVQAIPRVRRVSKERQA